MRSIQIQVDQKQRELSEHGTPQFPLEINHDVLDDFDEHAIRCHWHEELEIPVVVQGAVCCQLKDQTFELKAIACDGIEACRMALLKASKKVLPANFIEGMACIGGCIGGAGCLTHGEKNKAEVDKYGRQALEKTIADAVSVLK